MASKRIRVSVIEDDQGTREKVLSIIKASSNLEFWEAYPSAEDALTGIPGNPPDVVLMDINLPGMSGIECVRQLKAKLPQVQVLMLTTYEDSKLIFDSLRSGASGYLLKKVAAEEIVQAVEQVHAGGSPMSMHIARKVVNHFQDNKPASEISQLSKREQEILGLLAKGFVYKEIADQLKISPGTVRVHLHTIYEKLHVQSGIQAVVKFLGKE